MAIWTLGKFSSFFGGNKVKAFLPPRFFLCEDVVNWALLSGRRSIWQLIIVLVDIVGMDETMDRIQADLGRRKHFLSFLTPKLTQLTLKPKQVLACLPVNRFYC